MFIHAVQVVVALALIIVVLALLVGMTFLMGSCTLCTFLKSSRNQTQVYILC